MHVLINRTDLEDCLEDCLGGLPDLDCWLHLHTSWAVQLQRHDRILSLLRNFSHLRPKRDKQPDGPTEYDIACDCGEGL